MGGGDGVVGVRRESGGVWGWSGGRGVGMGKGMYMYIVLTPADL